VTFDNRAGHSRDSITVAQRELGLIVRIIIRHRPQLRPRVAATLPSVNTRPPSRASSIGEYRMVSELRKENIHKEILSGSKGRNVATALWAACRALTERQEAKIIDDARNWRSLIVS
jgi:hypothetical protein